MVLEGNGIRLIRLREEDIELVRVKRNSEEIRRFMRYRSEITPEMQQKWFISVNNEFNNYFTIEFNGEKIGLIHGAQIDWEKKVTGNGGIFIWEMKYRESPIPLAAALLLTDTTFVVGLEKSFIRVRKDNPNAIAFNKNLGYVPFRELDDEETYCFVLQEDNYKRKSERFRASFRRNYGDKFTVTLDNVNDPMESRILNILRLNTSEKNSVLKLIVK